MTWTTLGSLRGPAGRDGRDVQRHDVVVVSPSAEWVIDTTAWGEATSVTLFDADDNEIDAAVNITATTVTITWFYPETGRARLII